MAFSFGSLGKHAQCTAGQAGHLFGGGEEKGKGFGSVENVVGESGGELRKLLGDGVESRFVLA